MSEYNEHTFNRMVRQAEKNGEQVVFVLERETEFALGGVNVYKVPVPGELDREKHKLAWFMYLPQFHGPRPHVDCRCSECRAFDRSLRNDSGPSDLGDADLRDTADGVLCQEPAE